MNKTVREVMFMPWTDVTNDLTIGPFRFWKWDPSRVSEPQIGSHLDECFTSYVDYFGEPVSTITIVSTDDAFNPVSSSMMEKARVAADFLMFAEIYPQINANLRDDKWQVAPPTADRYQLFKQTFTPGDTSFSIETVGPVSRAMHVGKIGRLRVSSPLNLGAPGFPDDDLVQALGQLFRPKIRAAVRKRIARSVEWFRLAHTASDDTSLLTKVVMMSTAFEILLAFPDNLKTSYFIQTVRSRLDRPETRVRTRLDFRRRKKPYSLPGWWAHDFYNLRSRIVHGDVVKMSSLKYKDRLGHLVVATFVFGQCLIQELYDLRIFGQDLRRISRQWDKSVSTSSVGSSETRINDWLLGFGDIHRTLGWIPQRK